MRTIWRRERGVEGRWGKGGVGEHHPAVGGFTVQGLGLRVKGLEFMVWGQGLGFGFWGLGFKVCGLGFGFEIWGLGFRVWWPSRHNRLARSHFPSTRNPFFFFITLKPRVEPFTAPPQHSASERRGNNSKGFNDFYLHQGQNMDLTVLCVPYSGEPSHNPNTDSGPDQQPMRTDSQRSLCQWCRTGVPRSSETAAP